MSTQSEERLYGAEPAVSGIDLGAAITYSGMPELPVITAASTSPTSRGSASWASQRASGQCGMLA